MTLREMRKSRGLTSTSATARMGVQKNTITTLESTMGTRKINISIIARIAKAYDYPITDVVYACVGKEKNNEELYLNNYTEASSLRELRELMGYRKLQVAKAIGVTRGSLRNLECSLVVPHSHHIYKLHKLYKISCENVFDVCVKQFKNISKKD